MTFSKISKTQKLPSKTPSNPKIQKFKKSYKDASNKKCSEKKTLVRIEKY